MSTPPCILLTNKIKPSPLSGAFEEIVPCPVILFQGVVTCKESLGSYGYL